MNAPNMLEISGAPKGYCHSRKDGKPGAAYLIINYSLTQATEVQLPKAAERYTLSAETPRSSTMLLNGIALSADSIDAIAPAAEAAGTIRLVPGSCTFLLL